MSAKYRQQTRASPPPPSHHRGFLSSLKANLPYIVLLQLVIVFSGALVGYLQYSEAMQNKKDQGQPVPSIEEYTEDIWYSLPPIIKAIVFFVFGSFFGIVLYMLGVIIYNRINEGKGGGGTTGDISQFPDLVRITKDLTAALEGANMAMQASTTGVTETAQEQFDQLAKTGDEIKKTLNRAKLAHFAAQRLGKETENDKDYYNGIVAIAKYYNNEIDIIEKLEEVKEGVTAQFPRPHLADT